MNAPRFEHYWVGVVVFPGLRGRPPFVACVVVGDSSRWEHYLLGRMSAAGHLVSGGFPRRFHLREDIGSRMFGWLVGLGYPPSHAIELAAAVVGSAASSSRPQTG